ncbi:MAG: glycosyltransferase family 4 protein, partial [Anaerolineae bacterium]|nr:glycosyltransferase family 4 protein [Anaerolineae bacterium]
QSSDVVLAVPSNSIFDSPADFSLLPYDSGTDSRLVDAIGAAKVVVIPAIWLAQVPALLQSDVPVVVDGYDPVTPETLSLGNQVTNLQTQLTQAYLRGDFFMCASERQRYWWLGLLEMCGRINAHTFQDDASLRRLLDVVPFGFPGSPPQHTRPVIKGIWPGIEENDKLILWGGGLWNWLDPLTAIRAIALIYEQRQDVRLVFPGTKHPNPDLDGMPTQNRSALELSQELGVLDKAVFFGDWVPYADWPNVLLETAVALTLHHDTLETQLAFRSRVLDYIWAGLPVVATRGDATSDLVARHHLGVVVDYGDVEGVATAILQLLDMPALSLESQFAAARQQLSWQQAAQPLVEFCREPRRAADVGERVGNPYYISQLDALSQDRDHWQNLVKRYEQGRFMRFMKWLSGLRYKL